MQEFGSITNPKDVTTKQYVEDNFCGQVSSLPTASSDNNLKIYQYIGETGITHTNGYFYQCKEDTTTSPSTYSWVEINVQEPVSIEHKADKATTLAGYGIADAKIESESSDDVKKITLGSNNVRVGLSILGKLTVNGRSMNIQTKLGSDNAGSNMSIGVESNVLKFNATDTTYTSGTGLTITNANVINHTNSTTAGTYNSVTVDSEGHVTTGTNPTTLTGYGITDAYTKTESDNKFLENAVDDITADFTFNVSAETLSKIKAYKYGKLIMITCDGGVLMNSTFTTIPSKYKPSATMYGSAWNFNDNIQYAVKAVSTGDLSILGSSIDDVVFFTFQWLI